MKRIYFSIFAAAAISVLLVSCQRDEFQEEIKEEAVVNYDPVVEDVEEKDTQPVGNPLINEEGPGTQPFKDMSFFVTAWDSAPKNIIPGTAGSYQEVKTKGTRWNTVYTGSDGKEYSREYLWKNGEVKTFFAYANLPASGAAVTNAAATSQTLTYTVPASSGNQKDILLGYYKGQGTSGEPSTMTGTAGIHFYHPLTAVRFKKGTLSDGVTVTGVSIDGVYPAGKTSQSGATSTFAWTKADGSAFSKADETYKVSLSKVTVDEEGVIGEAFLLIPQAFAENTDARIEVSLSTTSGSKTVYYPLEGAVWSAGYLTEYTIGYDDTLFEISVDGEIKVGRYLGDDLAYSVTSTAAWKLQYTLDNGANWTDAVADEAIGETGKEWISFDKVAGVASATPVSVKANVFVPDAALETVTIDHNANLRNASPRGTQAAPWDLSTHDIFGNPNEGGKVRTANCYVVSAPGWYSFPLVYGNAIDQFIAGGSNVQAYNPAGTASTTFLKPFIKGDGTGITGPYIEGAANVYPLWEDVEEYGIVSNTATDCSIVGTGADAKVVFHVNQGTLTQSNVLLAVTDGTDILWSWHIWVTDLDMTPVRIRNYEGTFDGGIFPVALGYVDKDPVTEEKLCPSTELKLRFVQMKGNEVKNLVEKTVVREEYIPNYAQIGYATVWQTGRKDPFIRGGVSESKCSGQYMVKTDYSEECTYDYSIRYPYRFIASNVGANSWLAGNPYHNYWSALYEGNGGSAGYSEKPVKTVYDPCPPGSQVPQGDAFTGFIIQGTKDAQGFSDPNVVGSFNKGYFFKSGIGDNVVFFNAGGFLSRTTMAYSQQGVQGFYNTAIPSRSTGTSQLGLRFESGKACPNDVSGKAYGFSIRPAFE